MIEIAYIIYAKNGEKIKENSFLIKPDEFKINNSFIHGITQQNPELLEIFDDMCLTWWKHKNLINLIKDIIFNNFDKNSNTYNISINFKMSIQSLIDNPKELLELINVC